MNARIPLNSNANPPAAKKNRASVTEDSYDPRRTPKLLRSDLTLSLKTWRYEHNANRTVCPDAESIAAGKNRSCFGR